MMYLIHRRVAMIKPSHANPCYFGKTRCYQLQTRNGKACLILTATVSLRLSRLLFRLDVYHNMHIYFFQFSFRCKVYHSTKYLRVLISAIFAGGNVFAIRLKKFLQNPSNIYALCSDETSASQTRYKAVICLSVVKLQVGK